MPSGSKAAQEGAACGLVGPGDDADSHACDPEPVSIRGDGGQEGESGQGEEGNKDHLFAAEPVI